MTFLKHLIDVACINKDFFTDTIREFRPSTQTDSQLIFDFDLNPNEFMSLKETAIYLILETADSPSTAAVFDNIEISFNQESYVFSMSQLPPLLRQQPIAVSEVIAHNKVQILENVPIDFKNRVLFGSSFKIVFNEPKYRIGKARLLTNIFTHK